MNQRFEWMRRIGQIEWTTRDKKKLRLHEMDCSHLRNVARMLDRRKDKWLDEATACAGHGDENGADQQMGWAFDQAENARSNAVLVLQYVTVREEFGFILEGPK